MKYNVNFLFDYIFPNLFLPNASTPDVAIVNYFTSINTQNTIGCTIHEKNPKVGHDLFGYAGDRPSTLTGFFLETSPYKDSFNLIHDSIFNGTLLKNKRFFYPIKPNPILNNFLGVDTTNKKVYEGNYFWKYISKTALDYINAGYGKILIDYSMEPFVNKSSYISIHNMLEHSGIRDKSIIICVNSFNADKCYENWFSENDRKIIVRNVPFCIDYASWFYDFYSDKRLKINDYLDLRDRRRKHYFLMKIRNDKTERSSLLFRLTNKNLLEKSDWSFLTIKNNNEIHLTFEHIKQVTKINFEYNEKIERVLNMLPHNLESERVSFTDVNAWTDKDIQPYTNSYFEVCFESFIDNEHKSLTEKIFKPIINFLPFIFVSFKGSLELLKELGFKTFDGFINEEYDKIDNPWDRLEAISVEIERICSMNEDEIHNWYLGMNDILIHNHNHLLNHYKNNLIGYQLIKEMGEFCGGNRVIW